MITIGCSNPGDNKQSTVVVTFSGKIVEECHGQYGTSYDATAVTEHCLSKRQYHSSIYVDMPDEGKRVLFVPDLAQ